MIQQIENGKMKADMCWEFVLINSTFQKFLEKQNQNY